MTATCWRDYDSKSLQETLLDPSEPTTPLRFGLLISANGHSLGQHSSLVTHIVVFGVALNYA
jgi:hypothetical protein